MTDPEPVDIPPAPRSAVLCSPWASPSDVPEAWRGQESTEEWQRVLLLASEILFYLSGRRFYGGGCTETAILRSRPPSAGQGAWPYHATWGDCGCWSAARLVNGWLYPPEPGAWSNHYSPMAVQLPRSPVATVTAVLQNGLPFTDFRLTRSGWLERTDGGSWSVCNDSTEVSYTFGEPPPESGVQATIELAYQLMLSMRNDARCQLPRRVQSVTRQGVSMTILDPQEFLSDGRTGLYAVDLFLAAVNPESRAQRAYVFSPDLPSTIIRP